MSLATIQPKDARLLADAGAKFVDIRESDEHARERISGAQHAPLSQIEKFSPEGANTLIFYCRSGNRTQTYAGKLAACAGGSPAYVLDGGLDAWKMAGQPVSADSSQPIEIMRQVQITAGSMVVAGVALGALVHPAFYGLAAFTGAGLMFAGISGTCAMARVLGLAP